MAGSNIKKNQVEVEFILILQLFWHHIAILEEGLVGHTITISFWHFLLVLASQCNNYKINMPFNFCNFCKMFKDNISKFHCALVSPGSKLAISARRQHFFISELGFHIPELKHPLRCGANVLKFLQTVRNVYKGTR